MVFLVAAFATVALEAITPNAVTTIKALINMDLRVDVILDLISP